ncbi:MAG: esterase [Phototrophicales bacterium]|nr:MAG: esterase [Phototrophicales bacterium]
MWQDYKSLTTQHTVIGDLRLYQQFYSPQLDNYRDLFAWLPPSYATSDKRYPVIYMHDGQNLFDAHISYSGEWMVDETITELAKEGLEAIVVGIPNMNEMRRIEYNPYPTHVGDVFWDGRGDDYIRFIAESIKPFIDDQFRTDPIPEKTGIAGSSMGGLISLHGFLTRADVFGLCGSFSPVFWTGLDEMVRVRARGDGRVYLDMGGKEGEVIFNIAPLMATTLEEAHAVYLNGVRQLRDDLVAGGYVLGQSLLYVEDLQAIHHESAWSKRLPDALRFLLK